VSHSVRALRLARLGKSGMLVSGGKLGRTALLAAGPAGKDFP
jgi:hypothetical protein